MAEYQHKENTGTMFRNDKREKDSEPEYKGSANIDGRDYWVSSWINETKAGVKYMKFSFTPMEKKQQSSSRQSSPPSDDVGF
jgi:hypothetical protein